MNGTEISFSVFTLIAHASFGVQAIMFILLVASVISWKLIFEYKNKIKRVERELNEFNLLFVGGKGKPNKSMVEIFHKSKAKDPLGMFRVFKVSFAFFNEKTILTKDANEIERIKNKTSLSDILMKEDRYLSWYSEKFDFEIDKVSQSLKDKVSILGTISATAPYIGLLGTVYGILIAFWNLGSSQQATIATVAPSIAEALIATGMGLFVAIPSLIAYNRLNHRIDTLLEGYEKVKKISELQLKKNIYNGVD